MDGQASGSLGVAVRAWNGLGYAYFNGQGSSQGGETGAGAHATLAANATTAFAYFSRAAAAGDGDALFNTGRCQALGLGTPLNLTAAVHSYSRGVSAAGSWACKLALGRLLAEGGMPGLHCLPALPGWGL